MKRKTGLFWISLIILAVICAMSLTACAGKEFTVTFDGNGGTLVSGQEVQKIKKGENATPPLYEMEGHTLSWGGSFDNITADITVTALWTPKQYTYIFYDEDGTTALKTQTLNYGSPITPPVTPSKAATAQYTYAFSGWGKTVPEILTENIAFTAQYTQTVNKYTYTFYDGDGTTPLKTQTLDYGSDIIPPATPSKEATAQYTYAFDGWDKTIPTTLTENITFTAQYTQAVRQYTLTFESNGGSAITQKTALYNNALSAPADPTKASYTFSGWFTDSDCTEEYDFETPLTTNITLFAKWEEGSKGLVYTLIKDGAEYEVTDYVNFYDMDVHIPALYKGKPVTSIGSKAFYGYTPLTSVIIPSSVTSIGSEAFYGCEKITSIVIPQGVTIINDGTFNGAGLTSVTLPNGLISIGEYAFHECTGLISVVIPNSVTSLGERAFYWCTKLSSITLSTQLTAIEEYTFYHCTDLASIVIPQGVTSIGDSAFHHCSSLTDITLSAQLSTIGNWAFYYCGSLTSVVIPSGVTSIGQRAFLDCPKLISVTALSVTPPSIGFEGFADTHASLLICVPSSSLTAYKENWSDYAAKIIPLTVTATYDSKEGSAVASQTVPYNTIISLPDEPTKAHQEFEGWYTDSACTEEYDFDALLTADITLYAKWKELGTEGLTYALNDDDEYEVTGYEGLDTEVYIPSLYNGKFVTSIGGYAFYDCDVTSVTIPASVTSIGNSAFYNCTKLTSMTIPASVTSIGVRVFSHSRSLTLIVVDAANAFYKSVDGVLFNKAGTVLISYPAAKTGAFYSLPSGITSIGAYAFHYCTILTSVEIPLGITSIGDSAFASCTNLTNITILAELTNIGTYAFAYCENLTDITIPASVTSIGEYAFLGCTSLTSIEIPSSVTSIGNNALNNCSALKSVTVLAVTPPAISYEVFADAHASLLIYVPSASLAAYKTAANWSGYAAKIVPLTVTATYDSKEGSAVASQTVPYNTIISLPDEPTKTGYTFGGWYTNGACTDEHDFDTLLTANITLYAKWEEGSKGLVYELINDDTEYSVTDYNGSDTEVIIPAIYKGKPVTSIGELAFENCDITSVIIPSSVKNMEWAFYYCNVASVVIQNGVLSIGESAFSFCENLTDIVIPNSVTSIGGYAFNNCSLLTSIEIPSSVTSIGNNALNNCSALKSVTVLAVTPPSIGMEVFTDTHASLLIYVPSASLAAYKTAANWSGYAAKIVPLTVTATYDSKEGSAVASQTVPYNTIISLPDEPTKAHHEFEGWYTNNDCTEEYNFETLLTADITLYAKWKEVGTEGLTYALNDDDEYEVTRYEGLDTEVYIPSLYNGKFVTNIGNSAFEDCASLTSISIPLGVTHIGNSAFNYCTSLASISIPLGVTHIGNSAFYRCTSLTSMEIPLGVTHIGNSAFNYCTKLTSVTIPVSVISIGDLAFKYCTKLTSVVIGSGVTSIGTAAFSDCTSLVIIEIPSSVTSIGAGAFYSCSALEGVTILAVTPPESGLSVFTNTHDSLLIYVPSLSLTAYKTATNWSGYSAVIVPSTVTATFDSKEGSAVDSQTVSYNTIISLPDEPTKTGYTFGGWYADSACTDEYDFDTLLTADITLYAKWEEGTDGL